MGGFEGRHGAIPARNRARLAVGAAEYRVLYLPLES